MNGIDNATLLVKLDEIRDALIEEHDETYALELLDALIEEVGK